MIFFHSIFLIRVSKEMAVIKRKYMGYMLLTPTLSLLVFLSIIPFIYALILSFRQLDLKIPRMSGQFIGLDNYQEFGLIRERKGFIEHIPPPCFDG